MRTTQLISALARSTALLPMLGAANGHTQAIEASAAASQMGGDIVVTATKQISTVSRVPLSITALSQASLDKANVRVFADVIRTVPSLNLTANTIADRIPNISIRGIASSAGAATTGIYIDDVPLQKRTAIGISGSGTPIPQLFDLERVEILRGPQGTLFGGSSMGGAIRFITPTPSLDHYSVYARAEVNAVEHGDIGGEGGIAVGGPLVQDKIGFRVSGYYRRTAGYIDHIDRFTGATLAKNTNGATSYAGRAAILFQPTETLSITPAFYYSSDDSKDADTQWQTVPSVTRGGFTYPEVRFGRYQNGLVCNVGDRNAATIQRCAITQPRKQRLYVPSLKLELGAGFADVTSITSYINDRTTGRSDYSYVEPANFQAGYPFVAGLTSYQSTPIYENKRHGWTQEVRLASADQSKPLTFVVGGFYASYSNNSNYHIVANLGDLTQAVFGAPPQAILGVGVEPGNITYHRDQNLDETSLAGFGELTYKITDKLKVFAGARVSRETFSYDQNTAGTFAGFLVPTTANGGLTSGKVKDTPVTPRFGAQYQATPTTMVYATAAKGYRVGGVNQPPPAARCAADLTALGITSSPGTYGADHLWSYEVGAKSRTSDSSVTINASGFYIDWSKIQVSYGLPTCGFGYVVNGGKAVSKGLDLQASVRPVRGLTFTGQFAYTDAQYTKSVIGPAPRNTVYVNDGDRLPVPRYQINIGGEYDFRAFGFNSFVRAEYQYGSSYQRSFGPGTSTYSPDTWQADSTQFVTARAGVGRDGWEAALYVDNLFNSHDTLGAYGGRAGCAVATGAACTTFTQTIYPYQYTTFRPRTIGLSVTVRK